MGERRCAHRILVERSEDEGNMEDSRLTWKYNIKTDLKELG